MGLISTFRRWFGRDNTPGPGDDFWYNPIGKSSLTGIRISPDTAMKSTAVLACVKVISETIAGLPIPLYRRNGDERSKENDNPLAKLIATRPCPWMTSFEWREMMTAFVLLRGDAYAQKISTRRGGLISLNPLNPAFMTPKLNESSGQIDYKYKIKGKDEIVLSQDEVFHLKGYTTDGVRGTSVISLASTAIELGIAAEEYGAKVFTNDARPGGILKHPGKLGDEAHKRIQKSWQDAHAGIENAHKVGIVEEGMDWVKIGMTSEDVQFIESRKFQVEEIARMFRVPPHLIQDLSRATFSNIEHQSLSFVQHTMLPWFKRWEGALNTGVIDERDQETLFFEFLVDGLLRGDTTTRYTSYQVGRQNGWLSANDIRKLENMEPLEGKQGDMYIVQANMVDSEKLASGEIITGTQGSSSADQGSAAPSSDNSGSKSGDSQTQGGKNSVRIKSFRTLFHRISHKLGTKELKKRDSMLRSGKESAEIRDFYDEHSILMIEELRDAWTCFQVEMAQSEVASEDNSLLLEREITKYISARKELDQLVHPYSEPQIRTDMDALVENLIHTYEKAEA